MVLYSPAANNLFSEFNSVSFFLSEVGYEGGELVESNLSLSGGLYYIYYEILSSCSPSLF